MVKIKRAYEKVNKADGFTVLVDRLWPRGIKKIDLHLDEWLKDIGLSNELRKWFNHDPKKWAGFKQRYFKELSDKADLIEQLKSISDKRTLTLLYSAKDEQHNQAVALKEYLE